MKNSQVCKNLNLNEFQKKVLEEISDRSEKEQIEILERSIEAAPDKYTQWELQSLLVKLSLWKNQGRRRRMGEIAELTLRQAMYVSWHIRIFEKSARLNFCKNVDLGETPKTPNWKNERRTLWTKFKKVKKEILADWRIFHFPRKWKISISVNAQK